MPLTGTETKLAKEIAKAIVSDPENQMLAEADWEKIAKKIINHLTANAVITGSCDGKPLVEGKIT